ncbi:hypothetical protein TcWFU_004110 [Taenia crassiceps]|uniref:Uncharacterized protein n=1 Tax=Taenia crassiceps TaxID=6207 RepID=A0ABR4Q315_9CEST
MRIIYNEEFFLRCRVLQNSNILTGTRTWLTCVTDRQTAVQQTLSAGFLTIKPQCIKYLNSAVCRRTSRVATS